MLGGRERMGFGCSADRCSIGEPAHSAFRPSKCPLHATAHVARSPRQRQLLFTLPRTNYVAHRTLVALATRFALALSRAEPECRARKAHDPVRDLSSPAQRQKHHASPARTPGAGPRDRSSASVGCGVWSEFGSSRRWCSCGSREAVSSFRSQRPRKGHRCVCPRWKCISVCWGRPVRAAL